MRKLSFSILFSTLYVLFALSFPVKSIAQEDSPRLDQIDPSIQDDTGSEEDAFSTDQLLQQENQWDEVERIIMGLDEEEYGEVFQLPL